ncbi:branched-chain amino acid ABC transporter permease [Paraburkholderia sp. SARCC-3016]|uniref:ABC transporter permease subunit n=1 Tax=Paraburkholderia sp. SARCC-3016 TaxID=3058611 RepID=UPI002806F249|nr:branched-chain amino acid ABC transporter permease [Paraburkholderia sp. SARCC-3016]MDQ7980833.1 branched-chain amino acid ABC transporter permease [Paraburkholderia sp. SARCC-3016]
MEASTLGWIVNMAVSVGLSIAILVLVSLGLSVLFGMMGIINLAHGEFLMFGAFATLAGVRSGLPLPLAMILATAVVAAYGWVVERVLIRHLYGRLADSMLATWGLSLIMSQVAVYVFGPTTQGIPTPGGSLRVGGYSVSVYSIVLVVAAVALLAIVYAVFTRTKYGVMARAAVQRPQMASAIGIDPRRINALTFMFGAGLAGAAGALLAPMVGVMPTMGEAYIARAFMTVVVGGSGVLTGAAAASVLLGGIENVISYLSTPFFGQAALLILAICLVRVMPTGISGRLRRKL